MNSTSENHGLSLISNQDENIYSVGMSTGRRYYMHEQYLQVIGQKSKEDCILLSIEKPE